MINFAPYIVVIWIAFWAYWYVKANQSRSNKVRPTGSIAARITLFILVVLLLRTGFFHTGGLDDHNTSTQVIGFILFLSGLALAVWARVHLGRNWGMPMSKKTNPRLVTTGPYAYIRHPIYTGILLAFIGTSLSTSYYWFIAVVILGARFIYAAVEEEKYMSKQLPKLYPNYKKRTKMLIPFIF